MPNTQSMFPVVVVKCEYYPEQSYNRLVRAYSVHVYRSDTLDTEREKKKINFRIGQAASVTCMRPGVKRKRVLPWLYK